MHRHRSLLFGFSSMATGQPLARLDSFTVVSRTAYAEAHQAIALDLRELALQDVEEIAVCRGLRFALLSSNLITQLGRGLFMCRPLIKLDLSANELQGVLPAGLSDLKA